MDLKKLLVELVMSWVRHGLTALGTAGVVLPVDADTHLAAIVSIVVGLGLGLVDKVILARVK